MKILVGILYSGEPQFDDCVKAIQSQQHNNWEHFVVRNLPKREAHQTLFNTFNSRADDFDIFVKVDADMELCRQDFFSALESYFTDNPHIDHVSMKVDDFYTAKLIWGMNAFRATVTFTKNDEIYTDKAVVIDSEKRAHLKKHAILVPAAKHAYNATEYQAFYFGCHKAIKVMERQSRSHMRNIRRLFWSALKKRDKRHLIAYAGAAVTFKNKLPPECLDHSNNRIKSIFDNLYERDQWFWVKNLYSHKKIISIASKRYLDSANS